MAYPHPMAYSQPAAPVAYHPPARAVPELNAEACNIVWNKLQNSIHSINASSLCKALLYDEYPDLTVQATILVSRSFQIPDQAVARAVISQVCGRMLPHYSVPAASPAYAYQPSVALTPEQMKEKQEQQAQAAEVKLLHFCVSSRFENNHGHVSSHRNLSRICGLFHQESEQIAGTDFGEAENSITYSSYAPPQLHIDGAKPHPVCVICAFPLRAFLFESFFFRVVGIHCRDCLHECGPATCHNGQIITATRYNFARQGKKHSLKLNPGFILYRSPYYPFTTFNK